MTTRIERAILFATRAHRNQKRKYTGEPYVTHPISVMEIVREVVHTEDMLIAALLHDTVEDTHVTLEDIRANFGDTVTNYVNGLTDVSRPEDGNRAERKAMDRAHTALQCPEVKTIKLADLIHNTACIEKHDPGFWAIYRAEKIALLEHLSQGDAGLFHRAQAQVGGF